MPIKVEPDLETNKQHAVEQPLKKKLKKKKYYLYPRFLNLNFTYP